MSFKTLSRRTLLITGTIGMVSLTVFFLYFTTKRSTQGAQVVLAASTTNSDIQQTAKHEIAVPGYPVRLKIPKINVDAALEYVALTPKGELGVPKNPANAAWFVRGPRPGEVGSAVIDGHYGYENNTPAVFDSLRKLQTGDSISVIDDRGASIAFVVRELRIYDSTENASGVFISSDGKAHLNLVTCQGNWNDSQKSYSNRLVVFTDRS